MTVTDPLPARVVRYASASRFLAEAGPFLEAREAQHNLILGVTANLARAEARPAAEVQALRPDGVGDTAYLATVVRDERVVAAAMMTPPFNIALGHVDDPAALPALVADLTAGGVHVPGVLGPVEAARRFAELWTGPRGLTTRTTLRERIYALERLIEPRPVPGEVRIATAADRQVLVDFVRAFLREALGPTHRDDSEQLVDRALGWGERTFYLWEDGGTVVSTAASGGPTPNGIRIGPVYTPPEFRGHGFASAVTAAATRAELAAGHRFVFLFTDLANPTSNKIYQAIGYEPVIDLEQVLFVAPTEPTGS